MGYTTDFSGEFKLNKPLDAKLKAFLEKFATTRRVARNLPAEYGIEGEFFVDGKGSYGQDNDPSVIDGNTPPRTQPGLWCQWVPTEDGTAIVWDEGEKFYEYIEWLEYIVKNFLAPNGYSITGDVNWYGEDRDDIGLIRVVNNKIEVIQGRLTYTKKKTKKAKSKTESQVKYEKHMKKLWSLAGEIGTLGESDKRYAKIYRKLSDALDAAEETGLIINKG